MGRIRAALVRAGLVAPPLEPHEFEVAMHLLSHPTAGPSAAAVPHIVTPTSSARCAHEGCDRVPGDPIHTIPED